MAEPQIVSLKIGSYSEASLVMMESLTPLHVGAGRGIAGSPIDLPIQRDAFGFPMISGSSLKGPIRQLFKSKKEVEDKEIFGRDLTKGESEVDYYAGAVLILDARLLSIPVRSLKGVYVEATCPYMLSNFATYAAACNDSKYTKLGKLLKEVEPQKGCVEATQEAFNEISVQLKSYGQSVILGDDRTYRTITSDAVEQIATLLGLDHKKLVICHDNDMHEHILKRAVIVTQRIKIHGDTKTVSPGSLWSEESLPQKSRLVTALFYSDSRKTGSKKLAKEIKGSLEAVIGNQSSMIFGGDETVGRGLCKIIFLKSQ